jgi:hypothetical protein|tara:strand:+ start:225 stop:497 length:273 start_codon:yes stop_codon:yes gene_type:complete
MAKKQPTKITKKELEGLTELQREVTNVLAQIGNTVIVQQQLLGKHGEVNEKWQSNAKVLEEKYGPVHVDLQTGAIKPAEKPEQEVPASGS